VRYGWKFWVCKVSDLSDDLFSSLRKLALSNWSKSYISIRPVCVGNPRPIHQGSTHQAPRSGGLLLTGSKLSSKKRRVWN